MMPKKKKRIPASGNKYSRTVAAEYNSEAPAPTTLSQALHALAIVGLPHAVLVNIGFWQGPDALAIGVVILIAGAIWSCYAQTRDYTVRYFPGSVGLVWVIDHILGLTIGYPLVLLLLLVIVAHGIYEVARK